MTYTYTPRGVCSDSMEIDLQNGVITDVRVRNGCDGSMHAVIRLANGCDAGEIIEKLAGIRCGRKETSCPDQLATALGKAMEQTREAREPLC